ncbi:hypothetical protein E2C01_087422 [Portunus trituberculatus]|uniref:Uncharacterized protein n=1 Tax=Portunus trituberculatus TaxID=210409 RepID=A0A5B7JBS7_PORTR|nr:hypothetical protein [Portunus trituberculatus]
MRHRDDKNKSSHRVFTRMTRPVVCARSCLHTEPQELQVLTQKIRGRHMTIRIMDGLDDHR